GYKLFFKYFILYVPNPQKQWLSSLTPEVVPLSSSSNIPWLVSMAENCQGIILSQWWILSTVSYLNKLKPFHIDISGVINRESILLGHKICMHPGFNQKDGTESVKGDIGVVFLKYHIMRKEIPLSHTYTIFWRNCYNCLHRHCRVYQYEKHNNFGTSIRKFSVKLLDLSFCHHQHINMAKSNNLCIWSQPQRDCLLQQGSPVLCLFGIHWELVGLVRESSITCYDPILVIKTAPYLTWMRLFIKASQKPMDPVLSLLCSFFSKAEHDLQDNWRHQE
uniref:Peptidase S1 domain-containing protein n=1 Tax=Marmota marmota marmota TaxID=9994 RepID=A0A8C5Z229_MARMA